MNGDTNTLLCAISEWIDSAPANMARDREAQTWGRVAKIQEEAGEAIAALIGATGQNPRKGVTHDWQDVEAELLDVALTALAAWVHLTDLPNPMECFSEHVAMVANRVGLEGDK
jgi:hypothetical protein